MTRKEKRLSEAEVGRQQSTVEEGNTGCQGYSDKEGREETS